MIFLDVNILCESGKVMTEKKTLNRVYTNFSSLIPLEHKFFLVYILLRCFCLDFDF